MRHNLSTVVGVAVALVCVAVGTFAWFNRAHPVIKINYEYTGASRTAVDEAVVEPVWESLRGCESISKMIAFSTDGRAEIYITGSAGASLNSLLTAVGSQLATAKPQLPSNVVPQFDMLPSGHSAPTAETISLMEHDDIDIDREKAAAVGLTVAEVNSQLHKYIDSGGSLRDFFATPIHLPNGKSVPLSDVARIIRHKMINPLVRTYP